MMSDAKSYTVVGAMSGTSVDGLDLALCHIQNQAGEWTYDLLKCASIPYDGHWRNTLINVVDATALDLLALNVAYGQYIAASIDRFLEDVQGPVDFVASHGHTVFHQVEKGFTYQLGAGQEIANHTGLTTICDFRSMDVALGGQGAPLVPIGDRLFFGQYEACLNLGGIANISMESNYCRKAFDVAPANMLLNHLVREKHLMYDHGGHIARKGHRILPLLDALNELSYYAADAPKSLGVEWFSEQMVPVLDEYASHTLEDRMCTAVCHIAEQVGKVSLSDQSMLVTGGGAKNDFLMDQIKLRSPSRIIVPDTDIIDFKEALIFALMGVLRMEGSVNALQSVTGASSDSSGGVIFYPPSH